MLATGILNPQINHLLSRVRHTNTLVIADKGFPFWPTVETIDISLVDGIPTVLQVLNAIVPNFKIGRIWMTREFLETNKPETLEAYKKATEGIRTAYEPHVEFKNRVPQALGLIRTADTTPFSNLIIESE